jgi:flagellar hook-length control protein FliK
MIDAIRSGAPAGGTTKSSKSGEPASTSFEETLQQADGSKQTYLETSQVVDNPNQATKETTEELKAKVAELEENSPLVADSDAAIPPSAEELLALAAAERTLTEEPAELTFEEGKLLNELTAEQAAELARLRQLAAEKLTGEEPEIAMLEEDGVAHGQLVESMNLEAGDALRRQRDLGFENVGEPTGEEVMNNAALPVQGYGTVVQNTSQDPNLGPLEAQVGDNPESGKPDLETLAAKERQNLMTQVELQKAEELEIDDPRFNTGMEDPTRAKKSIDEQIADAKSQRLANASPESETTAAFAKQQLLQKAEHHTVETKLTQQQQLQEILMQQHNSQEVVEEQTQTLDSLRAQQMILNGGQAPNLSTIDPSRLYASLTALGAVPTSVNQPGTPNEQREFRINKANEVRPDTTAIPQNQLSQVVSNTDTATAAASASFTAAEEALSETPFDMAQITRSLRSGKDSDTQEVTLRLRPDDLGSLTMRVKQMGDRLQIDMQVENPHVKQLVEANLDDLRNRFLDKDFNFKEMELNVNIDARSDSQFEQNPYQGRYQDDYTASQQRQRLNEAQDTVAGNPSSRPRGNESGLNLYA